MSAIKQLHVERGEGKWFGWTYGTIEKTFALVSVHSAKVGSESVHPLWFTWQADGRLEDCRRLGRGPASGHGHCSGNFCLLIFIFFYETQFRNSAFTFSRRLQWNSNGTIEAGRLELWSCAEAGRPGGPAHSSGSFPQFIQVLGASR